MRRPPPPRYKTRNWPSYSKALKRRGSLTIWFDPGMIWDAMPTDRRGRQQTYNDIAIQACLMMKFLFGMALLQVAGFVESLLHLFSRDWTMPDFSTLPRRPATLAVNIADPSGYSFAAGATRHDCIRMVCSTATLTVVRMITNGIMPALLAGIEGRLDAGLKAFGPHHPARHKTHPAP